MGESDSRGRRGSLEASVCEAVQSMSEGKGSSVKSILHFLRSQGGEEAPSSGQLRVALKSAVDRQALQLTDDGLYLAAKCGCGRSHGRRKSRSRRERSRRSLCKSRKRGGSRRRSRRSRSRRRRSGGRRRGGRKCGRSRSKRRRRRSRSRRSRKSRRRGCRRPCTRMWKPSRRRGGRRGKKCRDEDSVDDAMDSIGKQRHD